MRQAKRPLSCSAGLPPMSSAHARSQSTRSPPSVSPGATDTEMFRTANPAEEVHQRIAELTALQRLGQPADVADVVALLVSDDARWLTGQNIRASGGLA